MKIIGGFTRLLVAPIAAFTVFCAAQPATAPLTGKPQPTLPTINLKLGGVVIRAEVANTDTTRQTGMMFRTRMGKNEGMLFVFESPGYYAMWMRNTLIPLSVAYLDAQGVIVSIHEMSAQTENAHQAAGPVIYALEMNANWFTQHKIAAGDRLTGLNKAPKAK